MFFFAQIVWKPCVFIIHAFLVEMSLPFVRVGWIKDDSMANVKRDSSPLFSCNLLHPIDFKH